MTCVAVSVCNWRQIATGDTAPRLEINRNTQYLRLFGCYCRLVRNENDATIAQGLRPTPHILPLNPSGLNQAHACTSGILLSGGPARAATISYYCCTCAVALPPSSRAICAAPNLARSHAHVSAGKVVRGLECIRKRREIRNFTQMECMRRYATQHSAVARSSRRPNEKVRPHQGKSKA